MLCIPFCDAQTEPTAGYEYLVLRKNHRKVVSLQKKDPIEVRFKTGERQHLQLDTISDEGFLSNGEWIRYDELELIYLPRESFFYKVILRPLGPSLLIFGTYLLLNSAGLAVIHGVQDWRAAMAFRNAMISYAGGTLITLVAAKTATKTIQMEKYRRAVF